MGDGRSLDRALGRTGIKLESQNIPAGLLDDVAIGPDSIGTSELKVDAVEEENIKAGVVTNTKLGASAVTNDKIANTTIQGGKLSKYKSAVTRGATAEVTFTHGLGRVPAVVLWVINEVGTNGGTVVEGTHTSTQVKLTYPSTMTLTVIAF